MKFLDKLSNFKKLTWARSGHPDYSKIQHLQNRHVLKQFLLPHNKRYPNTDEIADILIVEAIQPSEKRIEIYKNNNKIICTPQEAEKYFRKHYPEYFL